MPIKFKKRPNFKKYESRFNNIPRDKLQGLANQLTVGIINRTQKGKDKKFKPFKRYSTAYKKTKRGFGSRVNLTVTNNMLHSINSKIGRNKIRLYFGSTVENAKAYSNNLTRKFFGIDVRQIKIIKKSFIKTLTRK